MKLFLITLLFICFNAYAFDGDDLLRLKISKTNSKEASAEILNLDHNNEYYDNIRQIELVGTKTKPSKDVLNINWNKIRLGDSEVNIPTPFSSKLKVAGDIKTGHKFSAKGSYSNLVSSMEELLQAQKDSDPKTKKTISSKAAPLASSGSSFQSYARPLSAFDDNNNNDDTTIVTEKGAEIITTDGCLPYVDYELNTIFIQQRSIRDGEEIQSCHNSSTSFPLQKNYDICPDKEDSSTGAKEVYFQYYYIDDRNGNSITNNIGSCQIDNALSNNGDSKEVTTTEGCRPYVDYELNQVFIQQRVLKGGVQIQSCHNSSTSFPLQKNYDICPDEDDLSAKRRKVYFQYYYVDDRNGNDITNNIDECQIDNVRSGDLNIAKNYDNCSRFVDISAMKIYDQYQEYYTDSDNNEVLLNDCTKDFNRSFNLTEDFDKCPLDHDFEKGYSTAQKEIGYTDSEGTYHKVYDCAKDSDYRYSHYTTSDTCSNIVVDGSVELFNRKYITINGTRNYISECSPVEGNVVIQEEECYQNRYSHDFDAKKSFLNKNYYYIDSNGIRIEVSSCIASEESFEHFEESSVCNKIDDDSRKETTIFSKTYIQVNGSRQYISDCKELASKVPYSEIGYRWQNEFTSLLTNISVSNSGDNVFIGSKEGEEVADTKYPETKIINAFNISNYSTTGKCSSFTAPSYNGISIDSGYSNLSSIELSNYVENKPAPDVCRTICRVWSCSSTYNCNTCTDTYQTCNGDNIHYYQRCTLHKCPLTKSVKYPIYKRGDDSHYVDLGTSLEVKYICGNGSALNGSEVFNGN